MSETDPPDFVPGSIAVFVQESTKIDAVVEAAADKGWTKKKALRRLNIVYFAVPVGTETDCIKEAKLMEHVTDASQEAMAMLSR